MNIGDFLYKKAEDQLDKAKTKISEGEWFDSLVGKLRESVDKEDLSDDLRNVTNEAILSLESEKERLSGIGENALTLLVHQIATGKDEDAIETYINAKGDVQSLIDSMNKNSKKLIEAKRQLDELQNEALQVIKNLATKAAKYLLPFLLAL